MLFRVAFSKNARSLLRVGVASKQFTVFYYLRFIILIVLIFLNTLAFCNAPRYIIISIAYSKRRLQVQRLGFYLFPSVVRTSKF
jgi:hypothetical protein